MILKMRLHVNITLFNFFQERLTYTMDLVLSRVLVPDKRIHSDRFKERKDLLQVLDSL